MIKLTLIDYQDYEYIFTDKDGKIYKSKLTFYDKEVKLEKNDVVYMSEKLFVKKDPGYCAMYSYGPLGSPCGRKILSTEDDELMIIKKGEKTKYLQRYYG